MYVAFLFFLKKSVKNKEYTNTSEQIWDIEISRLPWQDINNVQNVEVLK